MILLANSININEAIDLMFANGTREDLVAQAVACLEHIGEEIWVSLEVEELSTICVEIGPYWGVSRKCPADKYVFCCGFTIALLRALGLSG